MTQVKVHSCGASVTVQDAGWTGTLATGLSRGGVADRLAYAQMQALLGETHGAVLEMAGQGGEFSVSHRARIALTGAPMRASIDGVALRWNAVHTLDAGQRLSIGVAEQGVFGYLGFGGGLDEPRVMGSASTHRASGLGRVVVAGDRLRIGPDSKPERTGLALPESRAREGHIRLVPAAQTDLFDPDVIALFEHTIFTRGLRGNRQGVVLESDARFALDGGQSIPSETVLPGDIQIPGDGVPLVLLADCQTTGGYPRIASVLPCDLPRVVQAGPGTKLQFQLISRDEGIAAERQSHTELAGLEKACRPMVRDPAEMADLLSYNLISGALTGHEEG